MLAGLGPDRVGYTRDKTAARGCRGRRGHLALHARPRRLGALGKVHGDRGLGRVIADPHGLPLLQPGAVGATGVAGGVGLAAVDVLHAGRGSLPGGGRGRHPARRQQRQHGGRHARDAEGLARVDGLQAQGDGASNAPGGNDIQKLAALPAAHVHNVVRLLVRRRHLKLPALQPRAVVLGRQHDLVVLAPLGRGAQEAAPALQRVLAGPDLPDQPAARGRAVVGLRQQAPARRAPAAAQQLGGARRGQGVDENVGIHQLRRQSRGRHHRRAQAVGSAHEAQPGLQRGGREAGGAARAERRHGLADEGAQRGGQALHRGAGLGAGVGEHRQHRQYLALQGLGLRVGQLVKGGAGYGLLLGDQGVQGLDVLRQQLAPQGLSGVQHPRQLVREQLAAGQRLEPEAQRVGRPLNRGGHDGVMQRSFLGRLARHAQHLASLGVDRQRHPAAPLEPLDRFLDALGRDGP